MIPQMNSPTMGMPQINKPTQTTINMPSQNHTNQEHHHHHHHNNECKHHHESRNWNPFTQVPKNMRVFVWQTILNGDFFFSIFLSLPMMGQGYYLYQTVVQYFSYPLYYGNSIINQFITNHWLKKILGGFAIYYFLFHCLLFNLVGSTFQEKDILQIIQYFIIFIYLVLIFMPVGFFNQSEFQELIEQQPDLIQLSKQNRNVCVLCNIPKVARSQHCLYCQKCVKKWETHSMFFNSCIGVYNYPFYILFLGLVTLYFAIFLRQYVLPRSVSKSYTDLFVILINIQQFYYFGQQFLLCLLRVSYNITFNEIYQWRRYSYLWKNEKAQFGNPFDKGLISNWCNLLKPLVSSDKDDNWAKLQILNVTQIPGHPLAEMATEAINAQIKKLRMMEKQMFMNQSQSQTERDQESQGLLEKQ